MCDVMADGVKVGGVREEEYVSCQPVITLFVPLMDTLYGRSFGPVYYDKNTCAGDIWKLDRDGHANFLPREKGPTKPS